MSYELSGNLVIKH